jgi:hypothetical protein
MAGVHPISENYFGRKTISIVLSFVTAIAFAFHQVQLEAGTLRPSFASLRCG